MLSQETLIISLYPPSRLPPSRPRPHRGRQTPRFEGGPPPQCLTFIWINTFDQFHPPGKISLPSILPSPALPSLPPPPQCLTFIKINTFDQFCPPGKISFCPLCHCYCLVVPTIDKGYISGSLVVLVHMSNIPTSGTSQRLLDDYCTLRVGWPSANCCRKNGAAHNDQIQVVFCL